MSNIETETDSLINSVVLDIDARTLDSSNTEQKTLNSLSSVFNVVNITEITDDNKSHIQHAVQQKGRSVFSASELKELNINTSPEQPSTPSTPQIHQQDTDQLHKYALEFWSHFSNAWESFMKPLILAVDMSVGTIIHDTLHDIFKDTVDIRFSVGNCNMRMLDSHKGHIEMYISAKLNQKNIPYVDALYNTSPTLPNLSVVKFRPYHPNQDVPDQIEYGDFTVKYSDFGVQSSMGFKDNIPVLNIVIVVSARVADKILQKREVKFISDDGKVSSRDVWLATVSNAADLYLLNTLGEYNLLFHIGYIEFLHENDKLAQNFKFPDQHNKPNAVAELDSLKSLRSSIQPIIKFRNYSLCTYCDRLSIQSNIKLCSRCHIRGYCGTSCQRADWSYHKNDCKKP